MAITPDRTEGEEPTRVLRVDGDGNGDADATQVLGPEATEGDAPRLAAGIELIGEYGDSGFKEPPRIARRADGQVIQLAPLLYELAELADGRRSYEQIGDELSERIGRGVSADNVRTLADEKLRPLGVLAQADGSSPELEKVDPLLALKFRTAVIPQGLSRAITTVFKPFFLPPVILAVLAGIVAVDVWLFFFHGVAQPARVLAYNPLLLLMVLGLVVVATALHEFGHATAARYGGAEPGVMGVGIYIVWPAFYTDVTDAYRLGRWGRVRTDLGGIYFNGLFVLATAAVYFATGYEPLLILILVQHMQVFQQLLPFLRLDGYYILSDLTGVPDMFQRIGAVLKSMVPWKRADDRVTALKPWVRVVMTLWVLLLAPVIVLVFGLLFVHAPRIFATAYDSFLTQYDRAHQELGAGHAASGIVACLQMAMLALPAIGMVYSFGRVFTRAGGGAWRWSAGSAPRRLGVVVATSALAAAVGWLWWPNPSYKPIQPGERGTVQGGIENLAAVDTGRPSLTEKRERQLHGAPTVRKRERDKRNGAGGDEKGKAVVPASTGEKQTTDATTTDVVVPTSTEVTTTVAATTTVPVATTDAEGHTTTVEVPTTTDVATTETVPTTTTAQTTTAPAATGATTTTDVTTTTATVTTETAATTTTP